MKKVIFSIAAVAMMAVAPLTTASAATPTQVVDYEGLVDVGNQSFFVDVEGAANYEPGEPIVIFEGGYGDDHTIWAGIQSELAEDTLTISYDRAGLGLSEDTDKPKTAKNQVKSLERILDELGLNGPYLIVAHSIGGLNARVFADRNESDVAGIVFIDPSHEGQNELIQANVPDFIWEMYTGQFGAEGSFADAVESFEQARKSAEHESLENIPVTVLSAGNGIGLPPVDQGMLAFHASLAAQSTNGTHTVVPGVNHYIHLEAPQVVIDAARDLL
jgi:pimeloyl-ACP methyl ester carboxylesterase